MSSHGGTIQSGSSTKLADGKMIARHGDLHSCPLPRHGVTPLFSSATETIDGRPIVRVGDSAGCGAVITSGSPTVRAD